MKQIGLRLSMCFQAEVDKSAVRLIRTMLSISLSEEVLDSATCKGQVQKARNIPQQDCCSMPWPLLDHSRSVHLHRTSRTRLHNTSCRGFGSYHGNQCTGPRCTLSRPQACSPERRIREWQDYWNSAAKASLTAGATSPSTRGQSSRSRSHLKLTSRTIFAAAVRHNLHRQSSHHGLKL